MRFFYLFLICILFSLVSVSQTRIQVILDNPGGKKFQGVDIFDFSQQQMFKVDYQDTINVSFDKSNIDCYNIRYRLNDDVMYRQQIWLDKGSIQVKAHIDSNQLVIDTVLGSPMFYEYKKFAGDYARFAKARDTAAVNELLLSKVREHIDDPFSLLAADYYMLRNQNFKPSLVQLKNELAPQGDKFSWFILYDMVVGRLEKLLSVSKIEFASYDFVDIDNEKTKVKLGEGKYYLIDLWFVECLPCLQDHIEMKRLYGQLKDAGISIIGISRDSDHEKWKKYLKKTEYEWANIREAKKNKLTEGMSIASFPSYFVLDAKGNVIATFSSFGEVKEMFKLQ